MVKHRQCAKVYHKQLSEHHNTLCQARHNVAGYSPQGPCTVPHTSTSYCKMPFIVSPKQMMLEAALLLQA